MRKGSKLSNEIESTINQVFKNLILSDPQTEDSHIDCYVKMLQNDGSYKAATINAV